MTFSDHVIGPAIQASLLHRLGVNEVGGYNFLFLGSFVLCGLTTTWVLRRAGIGLAAAILGGIMFAFSPYRSDQRAHLQVLLMQWIPLMLWLWHRLLEETDAAARRRVRSGLRPARHRRHVPRLPRPLRARDPAAPAPRSLARARRMRARCACWCPRCVVCGALAAAIFVPYVVARRNPTSSAASATSATTARRSLSYLAVSPDNVAWGALLGRLARPENQLFAGLVATVLAILGVRALWLRPPRPAGAGGRTADAAARRRWRRQSRQRAPAARCSRSCSSSAAPASCSATLTTLASAADARPRPASRLRCSDTCRRVAACRRLRGTAWLLLVAALARRVAAAAAAPTSSRWERGLFLVGLFFALLALPVVFAPLQRVVPGLDGLRVPTRVYPFVSFALVFFAARGLDHLLARAQGARRAADRWRWSLSCSSSSCATACLGTGG